MKKRTLVTGAFIGGLVGGALVLLYAPQSGKKTRRQLQVKSEEVLDDAVEFSRTFIKKGNEVVLDVSELAKETADAWVDKVKEAIKK